MSGIAKILGLPPDQFNLIATLIVSFPLSYLFHYIKDKQARYAYSLIVGLIFQAIVFGQFALINVGISLCVYVIILVLGRKCGWPVFIFAIAALFTVQFTRMSLGIKYVIDFSTPLMGYVCKYTMFAWSYVDGDPARAGKLSADQEEKKLVTLPSLYHYLGYIYFFPTSVMGPPFTFWEFQNFCESTSRFAKIPSPLRQFAWLLVELLVSAAIATIIVPKVKVQHVLTDEFAAMPLWYKYLYLNVSVSLFRARYYFAFKLTEINVTLSGVSYGGKSDDDWDGIIVSRTQMELSYDFKEKTENWNCAVQLWIKRYFYFRLLTEQEAKSNPTKANIFSALTIMLSAVWHGSYPGYFLSFGYWVFCVILCRILYRARDRFPFFAHPIFIPLKWAFVANLMNYGGICFVLMTWEDCMTYLKATYFFNIITVIPLVLLSGYIVRSPPDVPNLVSHSLNHLGSPEIRAKPSHPRRMVKMIRKSSN